MTPTFDCDVLVLGGGMAGLAAAEMLGRHGATVELLEARARLGGRVCTEHVDGWPLPVELGAEFVHGSAPVTRAMAREAGIAVHALDDRHLTKTADGFSPSGGAWAHLPRLLAQVDPAAPDQSAAAFFAAHRVPEEHLRFIRAFIEGFHAAPLDRIGIQSLVRQVSGDDGQGRLAGGYGALLSWLAERLGALDVRVACATPVDTVTWSPNDVRVAGRRARVAIVALPHAILVAPDGVRFAPALTAARALLDRIETGHALRVVLRLREPVWERAGLRDVSFLHDPGLAFPTWWTAWPDATPQITAWCGGPRAAATSARPVVAQAIDDLGRLLDVDRVAIERIVVAAHEHRFGPDPWSRGAYTYAGVGGAEAPQALQEPPAASVFLAGEYTDPDDAGTVEAALASGRRAAAQALPRLG